MNRIFITGDTHGSTDWKKLSTDRFAVQKELTRDDYVIIAGDFGGIWDNSPEEEYILKTYSGRNFTTLFVDGNHENHDRLDSYDVQMWHGGKVHRISDSVIHLMRGQIYDIGGKTFFTMGGAESTDKAYRTEGKSWWKRELPSKEEYDEAVSNLAAHDFQVDYIVTHCAPERILYPLCPQMYCVPNELTSFLERLVQGLDVKFKDWYIGHYHLEKNLGKWHLLYNNIIEIGEYQ